MLSVVWRILPLGKALRHCPFFLPVRVICIWICVWSIGGITLRGENRSNRRKNVFAASVHRKSLMDWPDFGPGCPQWGAGLLKFLVHMNSDENSVHKLTQNTITRQNKFVLKEVTYLSENCVKFIQYCLWTKCVCFIVYIVRNYALKG